MMKNHLEILNGKVWGDGKRETVYRLLIPFRSVFPGDFSSWGTCQSITNILFKVVKSRSLSVTVLNNGLFLRSRQRTRLESHWSWIDAGHKKYIWCYREIPAVYNDCFRHSLVCLSLLFCLKWRKFQNNFIQGWYYYKAMSTTVWVLRFSKFKRELCVKTL